MTQSLSLIQKQSQNQTLLPQQIQTMKLLQATTQELEQQLKQAVLQNPVIELHSGMELLAGNPVEDSLSKGEFEEERAADLAEHDENLVDAACSGLGSDMPLDEISSNTWDADQEEKRQHFFNSLTAPESRMDLLLEQLRDQLPGGENDPLYPVCLEVLGNLDDKGYLCASDEEIAAGANTDEATAAQAVKIVQSLSPAGIGGHDLREVLLLQLERENEKGSIAWDIVDKHLEQLARNHIPQIAKELDFEVSEVQEAADRIRQLDPRPGHTLEPTTAPVVVPDVAIQQDAEGHWVSRLNKDAFPEIIISPKYEAMQKDKSLSREDRAFLTKNLEEGKNLQHDLDFRKSTIERISDAIIELQPDFLERGESGLKPLVMATVAEMLGLHETTISRGIANKFVRTPFGVFPFRHFFTSGFQDSEGQDISSRAVKLKIAELVKTEDPAKPLSDQKISELLQKDGLDVARRTIAKYREEAGIPAASLRKIHS